MPESSLQNYLGPIVEGQHRSREAVKRRNAFDVKSVPESEVEEALALGWLKERSSGKRVRLKRPKVLDEKLENRFWMLMFKLGYPELSSGRQFSVLLERKGAGTLRKQIDVFAKDDETVIVAECKASDKVVKRSLQKDIEEFANLKGLIAQSI